MTARLVTDEEIDGDSLGMTEVDPLEQRATMLIRSDADLEPTLVHELLHLRLICFGVDDTLERQQAMNLLASVLINAYPKRKRK